MQKVNGEKAKLKKKTARTKWRKLYTTQDILYEQLPYFWNVRRTINSHVLPLLHDNKTVLAQVFAKQFHLQLYFSPTPTYGQNYKM